MAGLLAFSHTVQSHIGITDPAAGGADNFIQWNIHSSNNFGLNTATGNGHSTQDGSSPFFATTGKIGGNSWNTGALASNLSTDSAADPSNPQNANGAIATVINFSPPPMQFNDIPAIPGGRVKVDFTIADVNNSGLIPALALYAGVDNTGPALTTFVNNAVTAMPGTLSNGVAGDNIIGGDAGANAPIIVSGNRFQTTTGNSLTASWIVDLDENPNNGSIDISDFINNFDYLTLILADNSGTTSLKEFTASINVTAAPVPIPAAIWLFGSGLFGLVSINRRKQKSKPLLCM